MATSLTSTGITFPDATTQTTAATTPTTLYAIGTYIIGRPQNASSYSVNSTISGSSLYSTVPTTYWYGGGGYWSGVVAGVSSGASNVGVGSWRCVSPATGDGTYGVVGLWVRYA